MPMQQNKCLLKKSNFKNGILLKFFKKNIDHNIFNYRKLQKLKEEREIKKEQAKIQQEIGKRNRTKKEKKQAKIRVNISIYN